MRSRVTEALLVCATTILALQLGLSGFQEIELRRSKRLDDEEKKASAKHEMEKLAWNRATMDIRKKIHVFLLGGGSDGWSYSEPQYNIAALKVFEKEDAKWINSKNIVISGYIRPMWTKDACWYEWRVELAITDADDWATVGNINFYKKDSGARPNWFLLTLGG